MFKYDLRESDDGDHFCSLEKFVGVNFGGSIITKKPLELPISGYVALNYDSEPNFLGERKSLIEFAFVDEPVNEIQMQIG